MKYKSLFAGAGLLLLAGCSSYNFYPNDKLNDKLNVIESSVEDQSMSVQGERSKLEVKSLEKTLDSWTAPRMRIILTNESDEILRVRAQDIKLSFNDFWFPVEEYTIVRDEEDPTLNFVSSDNFRLLHEILPEEKMVIDATFKKPISSEYYEHENVLIEVFTNIDLYNMRYKLKPTK
jgi:hypothetical protein